MDAVKIKSHGTAFEVQAHPRQTRRSHLGCASGIEWEVCGEFVCVCVCVWGSSFSQASLWTHLCISSDRSLSSFTVQFGLLLLPSHAMVSRAPCARFSLLGYLNCQMPCVCSYPAQPNTWRESVSVGDGHAVSPEGPAASFATSFRVARRGHAFEGLCWLVSSNNCLDLINRFVAARIRKVKRFQKASLAPLHVRLTSITPQFLRRIAPTARFFHRTRTRLGLLGVPSMEAPNLMFLRTHTNKCLL